MGMDRATLLRRSSVLKHGTTVATNAMITRTGSKVGLLTTKGHEDAVFIMRAVGRVDGLDEMEIRHVTKVTKPEPLVQRPDVRGIYERLDFRGEVLAPLDEDDAQGGHPLSRGRTRRRRHRGLPAVRMEESARMKNASSS